jgi:hypothetical protein
MHKEAFIEISQVFNSWLIGIFFQLINDVSDSNIKNC